MQRELQRLHVPQANASPGLALDARGPVDAHDRVQAMVLGMTKPAE